MVADRRYEDEILPCRLNFALARYFVGSIVHLPLEGADEPLVIGLAFAPKA
jgi:hypothetical protein